MIKPRSSNSPAFAHNFLESERVYINNLSLSNIRKKLPNFLEEYFILNDLGKIIIDTLKNGKITPTDKIFKGKLTFMPKKGGFSESIEFDGIEDLVVFIGTLVKENSNFNNNFGIYFSELKLSFDLLINEKEDIYRINNKFKEVVFYIDSNIYLEKNKNVSKSYKAFIEAIKKEGEKGGLFSIGETKLVDGEKKQHGIKSKNEQESLVKEDQKSILAMDIDNDNLKCILDITSEYFSELRNLIKKTEIKEQLNFLTNEERGKFIKKINEYYEKNQDKSLEPGITDLILVIKCLFMNIFTSNKAILISNDSDLELIFKIIYHEIIPRYYTKITFDKIESKLSKDPNALEDYLNKIGYESPNAFKTAIIEKARQHIDFCYNHTSDSRENVLFLISFGNFIVYKMISPLLNFIKGVDIYINGKTTAIEMCIEYSIDVGVVINFLESYNPDTDGDRKTAFLTYINNKKIKEIL